MILGDDDRAVVRALIDAPGEDFVHLAALAGLDPNNDFRFANLRGVDFGAADLRGFDFTGADLRQANLGRARLSGAVLDGARTEGAILSDLALEPVPPALRAYQNEAIHAVLDHLRRGHRTATVIMPPGTGKTMVLEAILLRLARPGSASRAIVVTKVLVEQQQMAQRLGERFFVSTHPSSAADVVVMTSRQLAVNWASVLAWASLLIFSDLDDVTETILAFNGELIAFAHGPSRSHRSGEEGQLKQRLLDNVVFSYSLESAVADGWLAQVEHHDCSSILDEVQAPEPRPSKRRVRRLSKVQLARAAEHFTAHLDIRLPNASLIVVDDLASVAFVTDIVNRGLGARPDGAAPLAVGLLPGGHYERASAKIGIFVATSGNLPFQVLDQAPSLAILSRRLPPMLQQGWSARHSLPPGERRQIFDYTRALRSDGV